MIITSIPNLSVCGALILCVNLASGQDKSTQYLAWQFGSNIGLAAVLQEAGATDKAREYYSKAEIAAEYFEAKLPRLPVKKADASRPEFAADILHYLLNDVFDELGHNIRSKHPEDHVYLFEIAIKSQLLMIMYAPGDDFGNIIVDVLKDRGPKSGLDSRFYYPLIDLIEGEKSYKDISMGVLTMHQNITKHLAPKF